MLVVITIKGRCIKNTIVCVLRSRTGTSLEQHSIENYILDSHLRDDHFTPIIKLIVENYIELFFYQFGCVYTERIIIKNTPSKRNKLTRAELFSNEWH